MLSYQTQLPNSTIIVHLTLDANSVYKKDNKSKYNHQKDSRVCRIIGCTNSFMLSRLSGRCDEHLIHTHDLVLTIQNDSPIFGAPSHIDIIDNLIEWGKPKNFNLNPFFEDLSFSILGNIPDTTILAGQVGPPFTNPTTLQDLFNVANSIVAKHFPSWNTSSYQPFQIGEKSYPAQSLAYILSLLVVCEEANRGNRWFSRNEMKSESATTEIGGALPIMYYAVRAFNWGVDLKQSSKYFRMNNR